MNNKIQNEIERLFESGFEEVQVIHLHKEDLIIRVCPDPSEVDASAEKEKHQFYQLPENATWVISVCGELTCERKPGPKSLGKESIFTVPMAQIVRVFLKRAPATTWKDIRILYRRFGNFFFITHRTDQSITYQEMTAPVS